MPIGNLTSQLFANIYLNEFDQFIKHNLKIRYYIRFADDFVILSQDKQFLYTLLPKLQSFLGTKLMLTIHPKKLSIKTVASGVDFLGWVHFPDHRVLRTNTKNRMYRRVRTNQSVETISSYLGLIKHGNATKIRKQLDEIVKENRR